MRLLGLVLAAAVVSFVITPTAEACYKCENECCEEANKNTSGRELCSNSQTCYQGSCVCYNCSRLGNSCEGTGDAACDNEYGICEEHNTLRVVPNGEPVEMPALTSPPVLEPARLAVPDAAVACRSV